MLAIGLALIAAVAIGLGDFLGGVASRKVAAIQVVTVFYALELVLLMMLAPFVDGEVSTEAIVVGVGQGLMECLSYWLFFLALTAGPMTVVSPLVAVLSAAIPVVTGVALGERPSAPAGLGITLAVVAIVLMSREPATVDALRFGRKAGLLAFACGVCVGLNLILLHRIPDNAGLWPLAVSRLPALVLAAAIAGGTVGLTLMRGRALWLTLGVGLFNLAGLVLVYAAYHMSLLSLVTVLASLYPAVTVVLAVTLLRERVAPLQWAGLALALGAVALIAAGSA